jgi:hypothetical protein
LHESKSQYEHSQDLSCFAWSSPGGRHSSIRRPVLKPHLLLFLRPAFPNSTVSINSHQLSILTLRVLTLFFSLSEYISNSYKQHDPSLFWALGNRHLSYVSPADPPSQTAFHPPSTSAHLQHRFQTIITPQNNPSRCIAPTPCASRALPPPHSSRTRHLRPLPPNPAVSSAEATSVSF